ncbi:hypothetical protein AVEN_63328-1 [Araneus ventricosus]|uniref:Uncharacterized protein n=1 Tax=Araneus ventricosus TaxID=182803 RepID=A0A4Y2P4N2_ARAVE|nr:hypothetical protein AVEN_63328-1 [Araneus ventricosus]
MNYYELPPESDLTETDEAIEQMETYLEEIEVSLTYLISKHNIDDKRAELNIKANKTETLLSVKLPDILLPQFSRRFLKNSLHKSSEKCFLAAAELDSAEQLLIKLFAKEITALQDDKNVPVSSKLKSLDPFLIIIKFYE